ncbi:MAG: YcaO-like family protein [Gammaproteobacteria bacterium]|nr:YcaO-like family protein [Gammaproteobacteria bacterium]
MININEYPFSNKLFNDFRSVSGQHVGLMDGTLVTVYKMHEEMCQRTFTGNIPNYNKYLMGQAHEIEHHLSGYGNYYEEAMVRLVGEGIERYAGLIMASILQDQAVYGSYNDIAAKYDKVIPFEYLNAHSDKEYAEFSKFSPLQRLDSNDIISWYPCKSLFDPEQIVWIPTQIAFLGFDQNKRQPEKNFIASFSKGTSCHISFEKALLGAILEAIEIDATMLNWYTKHRCETIEIDDPLVMSLCENTIGELSDYELKAINLTTPESPAYVFGALLVNRQKGLPYIAYGAQADVDPSKCLYRAIMEASAILFLGSIGPVVYPGAYNKDVSQSIFSDLDTNVAFYANPNNAPITDKLINDITGDSRKFSSFKTDYAGLNVDQQLKKIISHLGEFSEYAAYINFTPPEITNKAWEVTRVIIPEFVQMSMPNIPYRQHPRILKYGGVQNDYPHPLP